MRRRTTPLIAGAALAVASLTAAGAAPATAAPTPLERQVLGDRDGWAAAGGGTTGGSAAAQENVFTVRTWQEFRDALGGDAARGEDEPRIVRVVGRIDANTGADGERLTCDDYAVDGYDLERYLSAYDADGRPLGHDPADGEFVNPLEAARAASQDAQEAQVRQHVGSNVTIVGVGRDAQLVGAALTVRDSSNVIVRNLRLSDSYDCFPAWDPGDSGGNFNSEYDTLGIVGSTNVWVDHASFDDGENPPDSLPQYFGARYEVHDGSLDVTNASDLVTVSWSTFTDHDKTMLIGSSDSRTTDRGKLRVTLHHNVFERTKERTPRVRFGQVDVYNNVYRATDPDFFGYVWGAGVESQIIAEENYLELADGIDPADVVKGWGGTALRAEGNLVNGRSKHHELDLVALHNAAAPGEFLEDAVDWTPRYRERVDPAQSLPSRVPRLAGSGNL
ncbi:pectate lyase family protein [Kineococcus arenarius]|uniref:pectate lyase family protein n=1 Tax=Kineococcus sp. SYSU DK007 TaxID=3383128 RepID=UPI003D7C99E1